MAKSAAAKFAMKMLAAVLSLGNRQMTTMVMPFPIREKIPETKEKSSKKDRIWQLSGGIKEEFVNSISNLGVKLTSCANTIYCSRV